MFDISVVIPAHNEAGNIGILIEKTAKILKKAAQKSEIVVVDDKSSDNTVAVLKELKRKYPDLRIVAHKKNCGQSKALYNGILKAKYDIIATMDGDGQNNPSDIPKMVDFLLKNKNVKMIAGFRRKRKDTFFKIIGSKIANKIRVFLLKDNTPDTGCGLKVFYRKDFLKLPYFNHMHRFLPALFKRENLEVVSMEVEHFPRKWGKSHYNNFQRAMVGIIDLLGVMWLMRRGCLTEETEIADE
jgi:dolichol-phosphate mannosyltransferase